MDNLEFKKLYSTVAQFNISIGESDILNFLKITNRWPYQYYHDIDFNDKNSFLKNPFCPVQCIGYNDFPIYNPFYDKSGKFIFDVWKTYYDSGFTTMISDVMDLNEDLRQLQNEIFKISGLRVIGNFYLTNSNSKVPSWKPHKHSYDVIVKSIYGKSTWKIDEDVVELEGSTIGILSGSYHSVISCPTKRLSLTINIQ